MGMMVTRIWVRAQMLVPPAPQKSQIISTGARLLGYDTIRMNIYEISFQ
ncbi:Uncharacterised protein [Mycobacterium tuberculosis]|nr:Uncharacterised protein [Mycobacterium tuberculosis]